MERKTKKIEVRLTPQEYETLKRSSESFGSMSHYVKTAIREFSGASPKERLELQRGIVSLYTKIDSNLSHIGGNLNQAMRQCNETAKAGLPVAALLQHNVLPSVRVCYEALRETRGLLYDVTHSNLK